MQIYSQKDVDKKALKGARIAVLGYGSQGRAHALNLKDSGFDVVVGVRKSGASWAKAKKDGLKVAEPVAAVDGAALVAFLTPDLTQKDLYKEVIGAIGKGATILFAHGFNIHFKQIKPRKDLDVVLIAPKGPGDLVRRQYQQGRGVPCLMAIGQNATRRAKDNALAYAHGIGGTRGGVLTTTFAEETETDLFGEQVVLCGGATELVVKGVNKGTKREMKKVLGEIQAGKFARQWIKENRSGRKNYTRLMNKDLKHQIEKVGVKLRDRMPWLEQSRA